MTLGPAFDSTLGAARTGAEWAWRSLYRDLAPSLLRYLKARGADDPEDALGEIFLRFVRHLPEFEGGESELRAWLFTIARNHLVDEARRRHRRPVGRVDDEDHLPSTNDLRVEPEPFAGMSQHVREVLARLTREQREVLFLRVLAGLTLEETAQVLGKTPASVKRLQARGLRSLRQKMAAGVVSF